MKLAAPRFLQGVHWREIPKAERNGKPWKYVLLRDIFLGLGDTVTDGAVCYLVDADDITRGTISQKAIRVRSGYAWNGATCAPDNLPGVLCASVFHDLLFQFSVCENFPSAITLTWANNMFESICTTKLAIAYRIGLAIGSWAFWRQKSPGCRVCRVYPISPSPSQ